MREIPEDRIGAVRQAIQDTIAALRPPGPFLSAGTKLPDTSVKLLEVHLASLMQLERQLLTSDRPTGDGRVKPFAESTVES